MWKGSKEGGVKTGEDKVLHNGFEGVCSPEYRLGVQCDCRGADPFGGQ